MLVLTIRHKYWQQQIYQWREREPNEVKGLRISREVTEYLEGSFQWSWKCRNKWWQNEKRKLSS